MDIHIESFRIRGTIDARVQWGGVFHVREEEIDVATLMLQVQDNVLKLALNTLYFPILQLDLESIQLVREVKGESAIHVLYEHCTPLRHNILLWNEGVIIVVSSRNGFCVWTANCFIVFPFVCTICKNTTLVVNVK